MELSKILSIFKLNDYHFFKQRRNGVYICYSYDKWDFIRIGTIKDIHKEYIIHQLLLWKCNVANISTIQTSDWYWYYTEEKICEETYGVQLQTSTIRISNIMPSILSNTLNLVKYQYECKKLITEDNYLKILDTICFNEFLESWINLKEFTNIRIFVNYIRDLWIIKYDSYLYTTFMHGDFNLFNHCENWYIDFEDSWFLWFAELDLVSLLFHSVFFNFNEHRKPAYTYNEKSMNDIISIYKHNYDNNIENNIWFFILIRLFWLCTGLNKYENEILNYRLQLFNILCWIYFKEGSNAVYLYMKNKMIYLNKYPRYN